MVGAHGRLQLSLGRLRPNWPWRQKSFHTAYRQSVAPREEVVGVQRHQRSRPGAQRVARDHQLPAGGVRRRQLLCQLLQRKAALLAVHMSAAGCWWRRHSTTSAIMCQLMAVPHIMLWLTGTVHLVRWEGRSVLVDGGRHRRCPCPQRRRHPVVGTPADAALSTRVHEDRLAVLNLSPLAGSLPDVRH